MRFVPIVSDRPKTFNLYDVKFPCDGGVHDMIAVLPLRTATDKFDGGSGAEKKLENVMSFFFKHRRFCN